MADAPTLERLLDDAIRGRLAAVHTMIPGRVLSYDSASQKATVQPVVMFAWDNPATDAIERYSPPPIANVPVQFPSSAGMAITFPLAAGDFVTLLFAERSIDEWKSTGEEENEPQDPRRFDLTDAVAVPGLHPFSAPLPAAAVDAAAMVLWADMIKLGGSGAVNFVALANLVLAELNAIRAAYDLHIHTDPVSGVTTVPTVLLGPASSVAATKVKAL